jgi:peptidoglycan/LPS O-acetylase OafA/YrhL
MQYRPDIDGLRAIAVLMVLAFHFSPTSLRGGFLGVDVFFVISGYLISGILLTTGYKDFYKKRVLRLFPALLCCMLLTYGLGYTLLLDGELENLGEHVKSSLSFIENLLLKKETGYFDASAESKPLLHLWSLAVEEQFYILWPILLLGSKRFIQPRWFIPLALVCSLAYCLHLGESSPSKAFYATGARGWELAMGAMCFVLGSRPQITPPTDRAASWVTDALSWAAALLLLAFAFIYEEAWRHPGPITIAPVLAAATLIACGPLASFNRTVLSLPAVKYIGRISYPLYLFHWPLLAYAHIAQGGTPSIAMKTACMATSVLAAVLVHHLLERPVQKRAQSPWPVPALAAGALSMWFVGSLTVQAKGLPERPIVSSSRSLVESMSLGLGKNLTEAECGVPKAEKHFLPYCFRDKRNEASFAVWGDSKAEAIYWGLVRASDEQTRWMLVGMYSCAPVTDIRRTTDYSGVSPEQCARANKLALNALLSNKRIHTVLLVTASRLLEKPHYTAPANVETSKPVVQYGLEQTVQTLQRAGKRVMLLIDNPTIAEPRFCLHRITSSLAASENCRMPLTHAVESNRHYRNLMSQIAGDLQADLIDPTNAICDTSTGLCSVIQNGYSLYSYGDHYSDKGNGIVARVILDHIQSRSVRPE